MRRRLSIEVLTAQGRFPLSDLGGLGSARSASTAFENSGRRSKEVCRSEGVNDSSFRGVSAHEFPGEL